MFRFHANKAKLTTFFRFKAKTKIPTFSLIFALSEYERLTLFTCQVQTEGAPTFCDINRIKLIAKKGRVSNSSCQFFSTLQGSLMKFPLLKATKYLNYLWFDKKKAELFCILYLNIVQQIRVGVCIPRAPVFQGSLSCKTER